VGNSNYNALEVNLRFAAGERTTLFIGYTYSKSIDEASNLGEQTNPMNGRLTRVISSWDMRHNFVATYRYALPSTVFSSATGFPAAGASREQRGSVLDSL
jgi:hypothetical protein